MKKTEKGGHVSALFNAIMGIFRHKDQQILRDRVW